MKIEISNIVQAAPTGREAAGIAIAQVQTATAPGLIAMTLHTADGRTIFVVMSPEEAAQMAGLLTVCSYHAAGMTVDLPNAAPRIVVPGGAS